MLRVCLSQRLSIMKHDTAFPIRADRRAVQWRRFPKPLYRNCFTFSTRTLEERISDSTPEMTKRCQVELFAKLATEALENFQRFRSRCAFVGRMFIPLPSSLLMKHAYLHASAEAVKIRRRKKRSTFFLLEFSI